MEEIDRQFDLAYQIYERPFKVPLRTHYGKWAVRQGIFVGVRDRHSGQIGVGEIAPLPWFGTETLEEAIAFCADLSGSISSQQILAIPAHLPCTQFGLGCAFERVSGTPISEAILSPQQICGLLPAGEAALDAWQPLWQHGHRTLKWKIGVDSLPSELAIFQTLVEQLPSSARLRLDANGGLTPLQAEQWLQCCDRYQDQRTIEYLEQPLPPSQGRSLMALSQQYQTPLALDESIATLADLNSWQNRGWSGVYILKPAIMGFPWQIRGAMQTVDNPVICSSVFEASVGRKAALALSATIATPNFAVGFGVDHWLAESPKVSISSSIFS